MNRSSFSLLPVAVFLVGAAISGSLAGCAHDTSGAAPSSATATRPATPLAGGAVAALPDAPLVRPDAHAAIGQPAPDFTLTDIDGKTVHLHDYAGKAVVLEWFNPKCPFVNASHSKASLKGMATRREAQGVAWLAINSAAAGKQGFGAEASRGGKERFGLDHPILLDPTGAVGHAYGATNTPHMFVIDASGTLVYRGAIDNSPDGEGDSPTEGKLVNYVDARPRRPRGKARRRHAGDEGVRLRREVLNGRSNAATRYR